MKINSRRAKPKGKPRGKAFKKGFDPNRGKNGSLSNATAIYAMRYKNDVSKRIAPEALSKIVCDAAKRGRVWAIQMLHDDMIGKATQPISGNMTMGGKLIVEFVETRG